MIENDNVDYANGVVIAVDHIDSIISQSKQD